MLAPKILPLEYAAWNRSKKAPAGAEWWQSYLNSTLRGRRRVWRKRMGFPKRLMRSIGPFGFQVNSPTRAFEYPWCYFATSLESGMRVLEVGAGASGFQFLLAGEGLEVTTVDPLLNPSESIDWTFTAAQYERLNNAFGGRVRFIQDYLQSAALPADEFDRVFSISAIEHIPPGEIPSLMREISRVLKPGGYFVATVDLFVDCQPFTERPKNRFGTNICIQAMVEESGLSLEYGRTAELCGFPEFSPESIRHRINEYLVVNDVLVQCIVLRKPSRPRADCA